MVHLIYYTRSPNPTQPVFLQNIFVPFRAHANVKIIYGHVDIGVLRLSFSIFWQIFFRVKKTNICTKSFRAIWNGTRP